MPGLFGVLSNGQNPYNDYFRLFQDHAKRHESIHFHEDFNFTFCLIHNNKFYNDKLFTKTEAHFIMTDGVLLNSKELRQIYHAKDNSDLIGKMYSLKGSEFVNELRGSFNIVIFDFTKKKLMLYSDFISSIPLYYFHDSKINILLFGSDLVILSALLRKLGYNLQLSRVGAYCILTFGFMLQNTTLIENVHKIIPGTMISYNNNNLIQSRYYMLKNEPYITESKDEIIQKLNTLFDQAIKREFDKDLEYGYRHIGTLSGGLDSRMTLLRASGMGYDKMLAITFSQSNYLDETIAKQIAADLQFEFLFYSLDNGNFLLDIEGPIYANGGQVFFGGAAHQLAMESLINWEDFGLLHTGNVGDGILGSLIIDKKSDEFSEKKAYSFAYSKRLIEKIPKNLFTKLHENYNTTELFAIYERGFNCALNGAWMTRQFSECTSPFLDRDFLEYSLRIPPELKYKEWIYVEWVKRYYPEIAKYKWEKTGCKVGANCVYVALMRIEKIIKNTINRKMKKTYSMNPHESWLWTNKKLLEEFNRYYTDMLVLLDDYEEIQKDVMYLYENGNLLEKTQALSLLASIKILNINLKRPSN